MDQFAAASSENTELQGQLTTARAAADEASKVSDNALLLVRLWRLPSSTYFLQIASEAHRAADRSQKQVRQYKKQVEDLRNQMHALESKLEEKDTKM